MPVSEELHGEGHSQTVMPPQGRIKVGAIDDAALGPFLK